MNKLVLSIISTIIYFSVNTALAENTEGNSKKMEATVVIGYNSQDGCSFMYSPVDFCDHKHASKVKEALNNLKPNFNKKYILLTIDEWPEYNQKSIIIINPHERTYYPLPIDSYSGTPTKEDPAGKNGKINYSLNSNEICVTGDILVYRSISSGEFCFYFEGEKFNGYQTDYMQ